ncbi:MAG: Shikimate dehydrogenase (NADP(+)) [Candidatus Anoxychlamydiales bacterium]|nr:Shikimate dehydrogenase (NADP(+)) [Candidatus Anoxychlamydiales bacterium]
MLVAIITGPDLFSAKRQIKNSKDADAIELRLDLLDSIDLEKIKKLINYCDKPIIFSLRTKENGGKYLQHEKKKYFDLSRLFTLQPQFFDLEHGTSLEFVEKMKKEHPDVEIIVSYHNFQNTPSNLNEIYQSLKNPYASFYKIATYANNSIDAFRMLEFLKNNQDGKLIVVAMGESGSFSRVISKMFNNPITYTYVDKKITAGQVSIEEITSVYNFKNINADTQIYALLGYPIDQSISHVFHNSEFLKQNKKALYVKINLQPHELPIFFSYVKKFPFKGFSVTKPLKEKVLSFLTEDRSKVDAINTILVDREKFIGFNTDGIAALDSIERKMKVKDKKLLLLGAGGAAKAIANEAVKRGANLIIFNRDQTKAYNLATKLQCRAYPLDKIEEIMKEGYDAIINATSSSREGINIVPVQALIPGTIAMDIVSKPVETAFLKSAQDKGCLVIYGMEMFINQAKNQFVRKK